MVERLREEDEVMSMDGFVGDSTAFTKIMRRW